MCFEKFSTQVLVAFHCAGLAMLTACTTTTIPETIPEATELYQIIGELVVDIDTTSSHANGPDVFGSGPVSSKFKQFYDESVAKMSEARRVEYFWAGMKHLRFQGGTMDLFLEVVSGDSALESFEQRLRVYIDTSESLGRVTPGVDHARMVLAALERRGG